MPLTSGAPLPTSCAHRDPDYSASRATPPPGAAIPLSTSEEISVEVKDISFDPIHLGTFTGTFRNSAGSFTPAVFTITQDNTVSVVFNWPGKPPTVPNFEEKEKQEFNKKYYLTKSSKYKYSAQNEECYFNKLEFNPILLGYFSDQGGSLFNREGEEVGKFDISKKQQQSRRKSFSRQATVKVDDTLSKYITLKKSPITRKLLWYLTISFDISAMLCIGSTSNDHLIVIWLLSILWFFCFGCQMFLLSNEIVNLESDNQYIIYLLILPGLLWGCVVGAGFGEVAAVISFFMITFFSVLVGIPAKICCGFPKTEKRFKDAIVQTGMYCAMFVLFLVYVGFLLVSLFAGTLYLYTTPYTVVGLFVSFAVLPPITWPVMYIIGYILGIIHEWKWQYIIIPVIIINFIFPFCLFMFGSTSYGAAVRMYP